MLNKEQINIFFNLYGMKKHVLIALFFCSLCCYSQNKDIELLKCINVNRNKEYDAAFKGISNSVSPLALSFPVVLFSAGLLSKDSITKQKSIVIGASVLTAAVVANILKYSINRTRPFNQYSFIDKVTGGGSPSFPSGHTSDAFSLATSISLNYRQWYYILPSYCWASAVGYSRMHLGVHYPSDVLAGAIIGAGTAFLCYKGQRYISGKKK